VPLNRLLVIGPVLVLAAWFAAGQWNLAGPETHAWLRFVAVVWIASLLPLPGVGWSRSLVAERVRWGGWAIVASLLVIS
jgi:hypothetical protein